MTQVTQPEHSLQSLLEQYLLTVLKRLAERLDPPPVAKDKASLVQHLAAGLPRQARVHAALAALAPADRALLEALQRAGGQVAYGTVALWCHLGLLPLGLPRNNRGQWRGGAGIPESRSSHLNDAIARLELAGLCFGQGSRASYDRTRALDFGLAQQLVIPQQIADLLPPPPPLPAPRPADGPPPQVLAADAQAGQRQLFLLWSWLWRAEPALLKATGLLVKREIKRLGAALPHWVLPEAAEEEQAWLPWAHLTLVELGLLRTGERCEAFPERADHLWRFPLAERLGFCLNACKTQPMDLELRSSGMPTSSAELRSWAKARSTVLDQLRALARCGDADAWWSVDELGRALALGDRDWLIRPSGSSYSYYHVPDGDYRPNRYDGGHVFTRAPEGTGSDVDGWTRVEMVFVRHLLIQLWWLGLVDLGGADGLAAPLPAPAALSHLRLSPWGRHLLLDETQPTQDAAGEGRVVLQPNLQILVMGPVPESRLWALEQLADRVSADRAIVYQLSRESCYRAQQAGLDAATQLSRLESLTGGPVPQNVAQSLRDWAALHGRVVLRRLPLLLEAAPGEARRLAEAAGPSLLQPLGMGYFLVQDRAAFAAHAHAQGQAFEREPAGKVRATPPFQMAADGRLTRQARTLDPRCLSALQWVAEGDEEAGWRVTPAAIRQAKASRDADAYLLWDQLNTLCGEPPPEARQIIQRGLSAGGRALRYRGSFLELPDQTALEVLAGLPGLAGRLRQPEPQGPLVWVADDDLPALLEGLAEAGMEIEDAAAAAPAAGSPVASSTAPTAPKRRGRPPKGR